MICIKKITDKDFGLEEKTLTNPRLRLGARGIVINKDNKIAILNKTKKNEFKLVGGGIELDEEPDLAFKREVLEETGCEIEITSFLGTIEEIESNDNFKQISYVYVGNVLNDIETTNFTEMEIEEGSRLLWLDVKDAMELIKSAEDNLVASKYADVYSSRFTVKRDYEILKYYLNNKD